MKYNLSAFLVAHVVATTLLCRGDIKLQRVLTPDCVTRYFISGSCKPVDPAMDPDAAGRVEFKPESGDMLETDHRLTKAALLDLGRCWPGAVAFKDLAARALA